MSSGIREISGGDPWDPLIKGPAHGENLPRLGSFEGNQPTFSSPLERSLIDRSKFKGCLIIGGIEMSCLNKPNRFHRFMMRKFFGWTWRDQ